MSKNRRAQHTRHGGPALLQLVVFPMLNYPKLTMFEYQTIAGESFFSFLNRSDQDNKNSSIAHGPLGAYVRKVCYTRLVKGLCGKYTSFFRAGKKNRATGRKKCRFIRRVPARPIISIARPTSPGLFPVRLLPTARRLLYGRLWQKLPVRRSKVFGPASAVRLSIL